MEKEGNKSAKLNASIDIATEAYKKQSEVVAALRCNTPDTDTLTAAEAKLRELKRAVDAARKKYLVATQQKTSDAVAVKAAAVEGLLRRRFFIAPSFEIYGGVGGLYDYGPPGCAIKNNVLAVWRQHFIVEEGMLELEATCLTPAPVLKASGHVDKFNDLMVKDVDTGDSHRADHLLEEHLSMLIEQNSGEHDIDDMNKLMARVDELSELEIDENIAKYGIRAPETGNELSDCFPFNLMFQTSIGPSSTQVGYLRPETAQGIFLNFKRLLESVGGKLPFACAQIGLSFRNEISPKGGLIRVREFQQAEIEHFVKGEDKSHSKFSSVRQVTINMFGREQQLTRPYKPVEMAVGEAVEKGIIDNETLGYFIARTSMFVEKIGMNMKLVRFRQHLEHEMAHYASDCWDLEIKSLASNKWVECAGLADRSAYDLRTHSEKSGNELNAREIYAQARQIEELVCVANKGVIGRSFKRDGQVIMAELTEMNENSVRELQKSIEQDDKAIVGGFEISSEHVSFRNETRSETGHSFYPSVIEPSFGVGRVLWCLWEHTYYVREGEDEANSQTVRAVLRLPACVAGVKCCVLPLSKNAAFNELLGAVVTQLSGAGLINRVDDSGQSIGRRYARSDELGTPFGITVDFQSAEDGTVTLRERDSTLQVRCSVTEAVSAIGDMVRETRSWSEVQTQFESFSSHEK